MTITLHTSLIEDELPLLRLAFGQTVCPYCDTEVGPLPALAHGFVDPNNLYDDAMGAWSDHTAESPACARDAAYYG
ncbi:hypothetical protein EMG21_28535 [Klebsiella pneumoniae]|nr:hypothetical protein EMG21_28535 [Klebsiella pneumoniae]